MHYPDMNKVIEHTYFDTRYNKYSLKQKRECFLMYNVLHVTKKPNLHGGFNTDTMK